MLKKILKSVGEYKKWAFLTPLVMIGEVLMEILIPLVMAKIIDEGINGNRGMTYILEMGGLMVLMACLSMGFGALGSRFGAKAGAGFAKNLRKRLFDATADFSFRNVDKFSTASLVTRLTTDVNNVQNAFMMFIRMAARAPIMLIGALIFAVNINARLSLVFLFSIPVLGICLALIFFRAHPRFRVMLKKYDAMNGSVQENLTAIRVVKAFVREKDETKKFSMSAEEVRAAQLKAEKLVILTNPLMMLVMYATIIAVVWIGGGMVMGGTFQIGELSSFVTYVTQILMSLMMVSMIFMMLVISWASFTRISEVLDEKSDIVSPENPVKEVKDGSVDFEDVSFSYLGDESNCVMNHINLHIGSGETIGIIGGTGSSKSTLVQLIPRLYDATLGAVKVGGLDVRRYDLDTLRTQVAMVLQKNVLFSGTIIDNLRWGNENATQEEVEEACRQAQAHDFIMSFPDGYQTVMGQGGVNVSGGQKQRLCIARALLKRPKIVILDDSTSAVDTATDAKIRKALREQLSGTTTIIIAQRISTVQDCDRVLVLDNGEISAFDTHENLLKNNHIYQEVNASQQKGVA
ncbi:MAG: ABC transporter ATP-binding protein [Eubacteriales bacterium]|nr:ABC transporter ATP-binding protein [Eubacteriales bacterium]MDD3880755.1 ABC transporter ATP-binding protein [Eubacteriales bacterium]MDD3882898.1 ABC transporter ATP-binding protein [Eubacteriales bacterium]MDD4511612.1 ABC transporter ATP-binding protein [Eubacteriales bacterium]